MARESADTSHVRPVRRLLMTVLILCLALLVLVWRIDNPRVERLRSAVTDRIVPNLEWLMVPVTALGRMVDDFQSYARLYEQNAELRRELQQMRTWREAALQLEQENARLLDLNRVQLDPELTFVTGLVLADSGSPFRRSVLLNVGARDGILDGWATMDGLGVVGRISGVAENTSRVILLTDSNSRIPVTVLPSGQRAILMGDNSAAPLIEFLDAAEDIAAGDRVITSGDGGVFPAGLLVGQVVIDRNGELRLRPSADFSRLNFLRVMRSHPGTALSDPGGMIGPPWPLMPADGTEAPMPEEPAETPSAEAAELDPHIEAGDG